MKKAKTKSQSKSQKKNVPLDIEQHPVKKPKSEETLFGRAVTDPSVSEQQEAVDKQLKLVEHAKTVLKPYQFQKGESGNPNGRPKDVLKEIGKRIAAQSMKRVLSKEERQIAADLDFNPDDITMVETIMLHLATSRNPAKIEMFLDRVYGKVPNLNVNTQISESLVARFRSKLTDAELERIGAGEDALQILLDKLPDVNEEDVIDAEEE